VQLRATHSLFAEQLVPGGEHGVPAMLNGQAPPLLAPASAMVPGPGFCPHVMPPVPAAVPPVPAPGPGPAPTLPPAPVTGPGPALPPVPTPTVPLEPPVSLDEISLVL